MFLRVLIWQKKELSSVAKIHICLGGSAFIGLHKKVIKNIIKSYSLINSYSHCGLPQSFTSSKKYFNKYFKKYFNTSKNLHRTVTQHFTLSFPINGTCWWRVGEIVVNRTSYQGYQFDLHFIQCQSSTDILDIVNEFV